MSKDILTIHKELLKEKEKKLVEDVKNRTPEIQKEEMIKEFIKSVNGFNLKERFNLAWRIVWRKL